MAAFDPVSSHPCGSRVSAPCAMPMETATANSSHEPASNSSRRDRPQPPTPAIRTRRRTPEGTRQLCADCAKLNRVAKRLKIRSLLTAEELGSIPIRQHGLIVCDCDGGENEIFTEQTEGPFADWDLLIETHDCYDITISTRLAELFRETHELRSILSIEWYPKIQNLRLSGTRGVGLGQSSSDPRRVPSDAHGMTFLLVPLAADSILGQPSILIMSPTNSLFNRLMNRGELRCVLRPGGCFSR